MMVIGGSNVSAALDCHQERQDPYVLAARARVRVGRKVRQVTVAQLGELDAKGRIAARHLADSLVGVDRQPGLFDEELPTEPVTVVPSRLRLERGRRFGSPASSVTMKRSDSPSPFPPRFVAFAWRYPGRTRCSLPWPPDAPATGLELVTRCSRRDLPRRRRGLPGSWGTPVSVPCSSTPAGSPAPGHCGAATRPSGK